MPFLGTEEIPQLTAQFFVTLRSKFARIEREALPSDHLKNEYDQIETLLGKEETWGNAYEIEQRMLPLLDDTNLTTEAYRRAVEAKRHLSATVVAGYKVGLESDDVDVKRSTTCRIVDDLQWHYQQEEIKDSFRRQAARFAGIWLVFAVIVFILVYIFCQRPLAIAVFSGMLGAAFSSVVGLNARLERSSFSELKMLRCWHYGFPRLAIGIGAATILFFLLQAGALEGSFFPKFRPRPDATRLERALVTVIDSNKNGTDPTPADVVRQHVDDLVTLLALGDAGEKARDKEVTELVAELPQALKSSNLPALLRATLEDAGDRSPLGLDAANLALLILWSVIAGFSERFVPVLLRSRETSATKDDSEQDRQQAVGPGKGDGVSEPAGKAAAEKAAAEKAAAEKAAAEKAAAEKSASEKTGSDDAATTG